MDVKRRVLRSAAVLAVAFAAGHLVQTMKQGSASASISMASIGQTDDRDAKAPASPAMVPASASMTGGAGSGTGLSDVTAIASLAALTPAPAGHECGADLSLMAEPDAMIAVTLSAPCSRGERVILRHAGLNFTARISAQGELNLRLPALETDALVSVYFPGSKMVIGSVIVPDAGAVQRFCLQWATDDVFDLRISEDAKIFVGGGDARDSNGGLRIMALGDRSVEQPMFAEVYTYPTDPVAELELVVEVAITAEVCGRDLVAEAITAKGGLVEIAAVTVSVPACDAAGDILVLKNLAPDMKIAAAN